MPPPTPLAVAEEPLVHLAILDRLHLLVARIAVRAGLSAMEAAVLEAFARGLPRGELLEDLLRRFFGN